MPVLLSVLFLPMLVVPPGAVGQASAGSAGEAVEYVSAVDGTGLQATLTLPASEGIHPGVVLLSIAGTSDVVERLVRRGYAVLTPVRRGFVDVEPLLQATYQDLAADVRAGLDYLAGRPEVDQEALAVVAQADDAPPAMLAASAPEATVPLVLMAPPVFTGVENFRMEQRFAAERARWGAAEVAALERYVDQIAEIALDNAPPYVREYRLQNLRAASPVQLPRSAAFPQDEGQMHFFASPLWHDRLAFDPRLAFGRLRSPVLVVVGSEDANTPTEAYLAAARGGLAESATTDAAVCLLPGRTRHAFTESSIGIIAAWLDARIGGADQAAGATPLELCPAPGP
jgi:pimeloyl-ACP methyl ester carboxylesterase